VLATDDQGGGVVVIPGATSSAFAPQDFQSVVGVTRLRFDIGQSFVSLLATTREQEGGAYNRVAGPDFTWQPNNRDRVVGQLLYSRSQTPQRPDLADEWDGRELAGHAASLEWLHSTATIDWFGQYRDVAEEFRADNGFVPQVGYRTLNGEAGYTVRPTDSFFTRVRTFVEGERYEDRDRQLLSDYIAPSIGMDGGFNSFMRYRLRTDRVRSGDEIFRYNRAFFTVQVRPSQAVSDITLDGYFGQGVDFANSRLGHGGNVSLFSSLRPTNHLEFRVNGGIRWLDVDPNGFDQRLFTASTVQLRATYTFNARSYVRLIGQVVDTERDPTLYVAAVPAHERAFGGSALFSYKLNWQSVLFIGYGDERAIDNSDATPANDDLDKVSRQWFLKVSYAFQRG
jgi:hypothetical protein